MATKNIFAAMADDSDDETFEPKPMTKTTKKKEERKIAEKEPAAAKAPKINESKMAEGGFEVTDAKNKGRRPQTGQRGGGEGFRGRGRGEGGRGGRGRGEGGNRATDARPRTGVMRVNEHGEEVLDPDRKQGGRFQGKPRDAHPFDKQSGRGRGTRKPDDKKGGAGRGNWGNKPDRAYKQAGAPEEGAPAGDA